MELPETNPLWIIALGKAILHSIWIGFSIAMVVKLLLLIVKENMSELRYWISVLALFTFGMVVIALFIRVYQNETRIPSPVHFSIRNNLHQLLNHGSNTDFKSSFPVLLYLVFSYLYLAGVIVFIVKWIISLVTLLYLKRTSGLLQREAEASLLKMQQLTGISRKICLRFSNRINSPVIIGFLKPCIVVPAGMFTHLPLNQIEAIILHELSHLKRADFIVNLFQTIIETLFFYHPAVWMLSSIARFEREKSCDDFVIRYNRNSITYANALLNLAEFQHASIKIAPAANGGSGNLLLKRIYRILHNRPMKTNIREKLATLSFIVFSSLILISVSSFSSGLNIRQTDGSEQYQKTIFYDTIPDLSADEDNDKELEVLREELSNLEEAMAEIDWEAIKEDIRAAKEDVLADIDWDEIQAEMEAAKAEIKKSMDFDIDMDSLRIEMDKVRKEMKDIDWDAMRLEMKMAMSELEKIDFDDIMEDARKSMEEIDMEEIMKDINLEKIMEDVEKSLENIDLEGIGKEIEMRKLEIVKEIEKLEEEKQDKK